MDILLKIQDPEFMFCIYDGNIHLEGSVSQNIHLGLSFYLCQKTGNFCSFFKTLFSRFHKSKTKA